MIKKVDKPSEEEMNKNFPYPTIDQYIERMTNKEAGNEELNKSKAYL